MQINLIWPCRASGTDFLTLAIYSLQSIFSHLLATVLIFLVDSDSDFIENCSQTAKNRTGRWLGSVLFVYVTFVLASQLSCIASTTSHENRLA